MLDYFMEKNYAEFPKPMVAVAIFPIFLINLVNHDLKIQNSATDHKNRTFPLFHNVTILAKLPACIP